MNLDENEKNSPHFEQKTSYYPSKIWRKLFSEILKFEKHDLLVQILKDSIYFEPIVLTFLKI